MAKEMVATAAAQLRRRGRALVGAWPCSSIADPEAGKWQVWQARHCAGLRPLLALGSCSARRDLFVHKSEKLELDIKHFAAVKV